MNELKSPMHGMISTLLLAALYFATGKLGLTLAFMHASASAVWPPTGIALAALLLFGYRIWPGIFLGAFLVNFTTLGSVPTTLGIAAGNTLEGLAAAYLVNRFANGKHVFERTQDVFKFMILAGMVATAVSATCGVASLFLGGLATWSEVGWIWLTWWLGDAGGALLATPVLVLWALSPSVDWSRRQLIEATSLLLAAIVVGQAVFGGWLPQAVNNYPLAYLCAPIVAWAAFRFGTRETATVTLLLAGLATWGTLSRFGPFAGTNRNESLILLQVFMIFTAAMALALATAVGERRRAIAMRAQLAALVESSDDAIIGTAFNGKVLSWNAAAERIFGYAPDEAMGKPIAFLLPSDRLDEEPHILERLTRGERIHNFETVRRRKDGELIDVALTISPIRDSRGVVGISNIVRDISQRKRAEKVLEHTNHELVTRVCELEHQSRQITLLSEMGGLLQSSHTLEEIYTIINSFAPQLFREEAGFLGILRSPGNIIETVVTWHDPRAGRADFRPDECWALRHAQIYTVSESRGGPFCQHLDRPFPASCLCVPIMAESETLGILHLQSGRRPVVSSSNAPSDQFDPTTQRVAQSMAQQIALSIANLKLRAVLRSQAMRDPLTGLFNRRYLTELLELELRRAERNGQTVGVVMLDIDHFKRVNDTYGHPAGDLVLRSFGDLLKTKCRSGDVVSRFGGEEFLVVMPSASLEDATKRAETLREAAAHLQLVYESRVVGPVTISLGVAVFPTHGTTSEILIHAADAALYLAKQGGRNQVVTAHSGIASSL